MSDKDEKPTAAELLETVLLGTQAIVQEAIDKMVQDRQQQEE